MLRIGFSTGALALGDFHRGLELQRRPGITAIELSALREEELGNLLAAIPTLDLSQFKFRSIHAPSRLVKLSNREVVQHLLPIAGLGFPIVVHPDIIDDFAPWRLLGASLLLENMDQRKRTCRTAGEMEVFFQELPEARFCFDIGHARQVDPTMSIAAEFVFRFRSRMAEIHISEVNWQCHHVSISSAAALAYWRFSKILGETMPVIIESLIGPQQIDRELDTVRRCLNWEQPYFRNALPDAHAALS